MTDKKPVTTAGLSQHDLEMLREFYVCFDRPAFKIKFEHESNLDATMAALADTIAALSTGVKTLRGVIPFGKPVEGKAYFESSKIRDAFDEIVDILSGARILFAHAKEAGYFFGQSPRIAFHQDHQEEASRVALLIDEARNRALEIANQVYRSLGYREFPYIRSHEYYDGYKELQALKTKARRKKHLSILDVLEIKPNFFGMGINVNALLKALAEIIGRRKGKKGDRRKIIKEKGSSKNVK